VSILLFFPSSEKWLEDKEMTGKRNPGVASKGSKVGDDTNDGANNSESDDSDAGSTDGNLGQKAASGTRWDSKTSTSYSFEQNDKEMEDLQDRIRSRLGLANFFHYVKDALFPYTLIAWTDPDSLQQYLEIKIEVLGSMIATDCVPKIVEGGSTVQVKFKFPDGGALLFPPCLLDQHEDNPNFDVYHPKYLQYEQAQRSHNSEVEVDERMMKIKLPFQCDTRGFLDPLAPEPEAKGILLANLPIPDREADNPETADSVQTKFLILGLESAEKPKIQQTTQSKDFSSTSSPGFDVLQHSREVAMGQTEPPVDLVLLAALLLILLEAVREQRHSS
jgi:hypothetical protein